MLRDLLDRPFEDVALLGVHLEVESLAAMERTGRAEEGGEPFAPEAALALADLMQAGPALTLDNPDVETLMERSRRFRAQEDAPETRAAQDGMSRAVAADEKAIGDRLRVLETQMAALRTEASAVAQRGVNRSVLVRIGRWALEDGRDLGVGVAAGIIANTDGASIVAFVSSTWTVLTGAAATYGPAFLHWFAACVGPIPEVRARRPDWRPPRPPLPPAPPLR